MAFQCDSCGRRIAPEEVQTVETDDRGLQHHCAACARSASAPVAETFRCDGDGCGKYFPVQLLREEKAGIADGRVLCPRCHFKTVGLQRRKVDAWMVTSILLVVLVFPVVVGALFSGNRPDEEELAARAASLSAAPPLPGPEPRADVLTRDEMIDILRDFLAESRASGPAPIGVTEPARPEPESQPPRAADAEPRSPGPAKSDPGTGPGPTEETARPPVKPAVDLAALDDQIDAAVRDALFERLNAATGPDQFLARLDVLGAIQAIGRPSWGEDLAPYVVAVGEDEVVRALAATAAGRLRAENAAASLRRAVADPSSPAVREASRHALYEVLGRPAGTPGGDDDVDWSEAFSRHERSAGAGR